MPAYFDVQRSATTNGSANTCSTHLRLLTVANQKTCNLVMVSVGASPTNATAGAAVLQIRTNATAGSGGTSQTPQPVLLGGTAASTTAFNDGTAIQGGTATIRQSISWAQTGGHNAWIATEPSDAYQLAPNGGANGSMEFPSFATGTSQGAQLTLRFWE